MREGVGSGESNHDSVDLRNLIDFSKTLFCSSLFRDRGSIDGDALNANECSDSVSEKTEVYAFGIEFGIEFKGELKVLFEIKIVPGGFEDRESAAKNFVLMRMGFSAVSRMRARPPSLYHLISSASKFSEANQNITCSRLSQMHQCHRGPGRGESLATCQMRWVGEGVRWGGLGSGTFKGDTSVQEGTQKYTDV